MIKVLGSALYSQICKHMMSVETVRSRFGGNGDRSSRGAANADVVRPDCSYLASSGREWVEALRNLHDQPLCRKKHG